jgi:RNA polymerase sigma-70 factor (ECF subfamily)
MEVSFRDARFPLQLFRGREYTLACNEMRIDNQSRRSTDYEHPHSDLVDDLAVIRSLQDGCEKCFDVLFARYWRLVFTIAWKILRERTDAEEIVQEVFLTLYLHSDKYDAARGSVKTWIAQFAHFKALIKRRHLQTRELMNLDEFLEFESGLLRFETSQGSERAAFVEECLAALNPRERRTVELIHFDGYTLMETAAVLKQSLANTRNIYYRGMKALRSKLMTPCSRATKDDGGVAGNISEAAARSLILGTDV